MPRLRARIAQAELVAIAYLLLRMEMGMMKQISLGIAEQPGSMVRIGNLVVHCDSARGFVDALRLSDLEREAILSDWQELREAQFRNLKKLTNASR